MFGPTLGTGDYGHITIEHVSMLFRNHRSLNKLSNQGFEAAHKLQRQLYAKATSHDASDSTSSRKFIVNEDFVSACPPSCNHFSQHITAKVASLKTWYLRVMCQATVVYLDLVHGLFHISVR